MMLVLSFVNTYNHLHFRKKDEKENRWLRSENLFFQISHLQLKYTRGIILS